MRTRITQLREERFSAFESMKAINDKQAAENRELTAEETQEYTRLETRVSAIDPEVARLERAEGIEGRMGPRPTREQVATVAAAEERALPKSWAEFAKVGVENRTITTPEYRNAWFHLMANGGDDRAISSEHRTLLARGHAEQRALSAITGSAGGFTVPTETWNQIQKKLNFFSQIRQVSHVLSTATGVDIEIPLESDIGAGGWKGENAAFTESDIVLAQTTLSAFKFTRVLKIPTELLQDSIVDVEAYIADAFARSFALGEGAAYIAGDGSGKPTGIVTQASTGVTIAHAAAVTLDNLIDLSYSVTPPYRINGTYMVSDDLAKAMRKFKDSQGRYLWQMNVQAGQPDTFNGKSVLEDPFLSDLSAGGTPALFGDMSYNWIRDVAGVTMQRLVELYAVNGQVGMLTSHRSDSKLTNLDAVKKLTATAV